MKLYIPKLSVLVFRVSLIGRRAQQSARAVRVQLASRASSKEVVVFETVLGPSAPEAAGKIGIVSGVDTLVTRTAVVGRPLESAPPVAWTDMVASTRASNFPGAPRWTVPVREALAPFYQAHRRNHRDSKRRLVIVGIDGADWEVLESLIAEGRLPTIARLKRGGRYGNLRSTIVPESAISWTSIRTGVNPGKHGVFNFLSPQTPHGSYWDALGEHGLRSLVLAVPKTSARRRLNGVLIEGWTAQRSRNYVYPRELKRYLERAGYRPGLVTARNVSYYKRRMRQRTEVAVSLLQHMDWDHCFVVYEYSDTAAHRFGLHTPEWQAVYEDIDTHIAALMRVAGPGTTFLLVSDHGWKRYAGSVDINAWLRAGGFEHWSQNLFSGSTVGITHRLGAPETAIDAELEDIIDRLRQLRDPDSQALAVEEVLRAADAFRGPFLARAPVHALVRLNTRYHAVRRSARTAVIKNEPVEHHAENGLYLLYGPGVPPGAAPSASVYDIAPTVLAFYGITPPEDSDGKPLYEFGVRAIAQGHAARGSDNAKSGIGVAAQPTPMPTGYQMPEEVKERLRSLGYIE